MNFTFERYQWIPTPDGKLILVDSWTSRVVENAPTYETNTTISTSNTENIQQFLEEEQ
jgi:hypothetical protein